MSKAKKAPVKKVKVEVENRFKALEQESTDEEMPELVEGDDDDKMVDMVFRRRD